MRSALTGHEHCITSKEAFDPGRLKSEIFNIWKAPDGEHDGIGFNRIAAGQSSQQQPAGLLFDLRENLVAADFDTLVFVFGVQQAAQIHVETAPNGAIIVDDYSQTNIDHIWAIGDVTNRMQLTPVAIHEAMCFVDTLYHGRPTKPDHDTVPTAVFSQPEIGTVGLSEDTAIKRFANLDIYCSAFRPMKNILAQRSERMLVKLVVDADSGRVLGSHVLGHDAGEMSQLLGIAPASDKARLR